MSRLKDKYKNEIVGILQKDFNFKNFMLIPYLEKIVVSVGAGFAIRDSKLMQNVIDNITIITGQKVLVTKAKKSVANFKVREGMDVGVKVTLRSKNMYNFLDKLISISLPKVGDFRGLKRNGFDGRGNYNFGMSDPLIFTELAYDQVLKSHGMNISLITSTNNDKEAFRLLELLGLPFKKGNKNG